MAEHLADQRVARFNRAAEFGGREIQIFKKVVEIVLGFGAHGRFLDVVENLGEVFEDELPRLRALGGDGGEQFGRLKEVTERFKAGLFDRRQDVSILGFVESGELQSVMLKRLIRVEVQALREVFVEDEVLMAN